MLPLKTLTFGGSHYEIQPYWVVIAIQPPEINIKASDDSKLYLVSNQEPCLEKTFGEKNPFTATIGVSLNVEV